jgi:3-hydroxyisobutyrate dehydrogenase-like beta-hydroxyacid dehydrogenase
VRVTVLGLGRMGRALSLRLLETGQVVTVWNRTPGRADDVRAAGGSEAPSVPGALEQCDVVVLSLADDEAVRAVALGPGGAIDALGDALLVDMSTVGPRTTRTLAKAAGPGQMVAAPVLGAPEALRTGRALLLLGGEPTVVDRLSPFWDDVSSARRWTGPDPGTATTVKLLANYLLMAGVVTLSEAVATAQAAGIDDGALRDLFGALPVVAPALHNRLDDLLDGDHAGWFSATLGAKDVRLAGELAHSLGISLPVAEAVRARYQALVERGGGDLDIAGVIELLR